MKITINHVFDERFLESYKISERQLKLMMLKETDFHEKIADKIDITSINERDIFNSVKHCQMKFHVYSEEEIKELIQCLKYPINLIRIEEILKK